MVTLGRITRRPARRAVHGGVLVTRETKVGLLVGLAFIVLFGVVISNSTEKNRVVRVAPLDVPIPSGPASSTDAIVSGDKLHRPSAKTEIAADNSKNDLSHKPAAVAEAGQPANPSKLDKPVQPGQPEDMQLADAKKKDDHSEAKRLIAVPTLRPPLLETDPGLGEAVVIGPSRIVSILPKTDAVDLNKDQTKAQPPVLPAEVKYTVKSGDSWFKIARNQWGEKFAGQWKLLAQANKGVVKDEKSLAPGMVLTIPNRPDGQPVQGNTPQLAENKPSGADSSDEQKADAPMTRLYTVKKGDTAYKIAEKELGDKRLYKAIIELNKESLKKDGGLAVGMRLKLPVISPATQPASGSDKPAPSSRRGGRATT